MREDIIDGLSRVNLTTWDQFSQTVEILDEASLSVFFFTFILKIKHTCQVNAKSSE